MVTISAVGPNGPLTAAQLGFQGAFNYCQSTPVPSSCAAGSTDVPVWNPATSTLIGNVNDTSGAAAWFVPTVPVTSITFVFTVQSGIPIYQVWFAAPTSTISGEVEGAPPAGSSTPATSDPTPDRPHGHLSAKPDRTDESVSGHDLLSPPEEAVAAPPNQREADRANGGHHRQPARQTSANDLPRPPLRRPGRARGPLLAHLLAHLLPVGL